MWFLLFLLSIATAELSYEEKAFVSKANVIFDIGAGCGNNSIAYAAINKHALIYAFEFKHFSCLESKIKRHELSTRILAYKSSLILDLLLYLPEIDFAFIRISYNPISIILNKVSGHQIFMYPIGYSQVDRYLKDQGYVLLVRDFNIIAY